MQIPIDNYKTFARKVNAFKQTCYLEFFAQNQGAFQIKKEKTISKNLERIFGAALKISNQSGFHAMSMRTLGKAANLSTGALYNYFSGKEELLAMMQQHRRTITARILRSNIAAQSDPRNALRVAVRTHLYLSEVMQPWFYFSFMEAKNIGPSERKAAVQGELSVEQLFTDIINTGQAQGVFWTENCRMTAGLIKAMMQDWYLKHSKHSRRGIDVEQYADFLIAFIERSLIGEGS
jgi:AcrR family transcriptional regulator